jgi:hypothetical protein
MGEPTTDLEATEPEAFVPPITPKPAAPPGWPPGKTKYDQARWLMTHYPTPEGNDPNMIGNLADLPYMTPDDLFYAVCALW